jgi:hypothetical protein
MAMKIALLPLMACLAAVAAVHAQDTVELRVLSPVTYVRQAGPPVSEALPFASQFGGPARLGSSATVSRTRRSRP